LAGNEDLRRKKKSRKKESLEKGDQDISNKREKQLKAGETPSGFLRGKRMKIPLGEQRTKLKI